MSDRYRQPPATTQAVTLDPIAARTEADAVADVARRAAEIRLLDVPALPPAVLVADVGLSRALEVHDLEAHLDTPRSKRGHVHLTDPGGLVAYLKQHQEEGTSLWAERDAGRIVAVIDDHIPGGISSAPGWAKHRATLTLKHTPEWTHWTGKADKLLPQADFADWLEQGLPQIVNPPAADVLEACRTLEIHREVLFSAADRPTSGEVRFTYQEADTTRAGRSGEVEFPASLTLELAPWEGCDPVRMEARLRYRLANNGVLSLGYRLVRADDVARTAWERLVGEIRAATQVYVFAGRPRD